MSEGKKNDEQRVTISAPNFEEATFLIEGTAPLVQHAFSGRAREDYAKTQSEGQVGRNRRMVKKQPKDFARLYREAMHVSTEGWNGLHAAAFRNCLIDACRMAGYAMTRAKCSIFVVADGWSKERVPLVRIDAPDPEAFSSIVRNDGGGIDVRVRPLWEKWRIRLTLRWDADQFKLVDVANLLHRGGIQVGVGEGRPFSKNSNGQDWGTFKILNPEDTEK